MYKIATEKSDPRSTAVIRSYLRVITLRSERSPEESLILFKKGMALAHTVSDKNFLLSRIETARSLDVFQFVVSFLDDSELNQAACIAVLGLTNDVPFHTKYRKIIDLQLDKVIQIATDSKLVERAKQYKERH